MTFKHIKFEDSVVMRSLEKLYKEKGLLKEEPLKKEASSKLDLRASSNLMENILKLCNGLRSYGLDKQANELESNYLSYKKANTLYETSKETGEDLINAAHPKGSHKVDVLGDDLAIVETILDRHLKMIKVVDKVPTGKLASSNIINSVKKALGEITETSSLGQSQTDAILSKLNLVVSFLASAKNELDKTTYSDSFGFSFKNEIDSINKVISSFKSNSIISKNHLDFINSKISNLQKMMYFKNNPIFMPSILINKLKGESEPVYNINKLLNQASSAVNEAIEFIAGKGHSLTQEENDFLKKRKEQTDKFNKDKSYPASVAPTSVAPAGTPAGVVPAPATPEVAMQLQQLLTNFKESINTINRYKAQLDSEDIENPESLSDWLDSMENYLTSKMRKIESSKYKYDPNIIANYYRILDRNNLKLDAFKRKWLTS